MTNDGKIRLISAACTLAVMLALLLLMFGVRLATAEVPPQQQFGEVELAADDEEFIEVTDDYLASVDDGEDTPMASEQVQPTPETGVDEGAPSKIDVPTDAPVGNVTAKEPSPVKTVEKSDGDNRRKQEEEERRRKADAEVAADMAGAFGTSGTGSASANDQSAAGTNPYGTHLGTATGHIGKGWGLPQFGAPVCSSAGTIIIEATIGPDGKVTAARDIPSVRFGGVQYAAKAPAGSDRDGINACIADVKKRTFKRSGMNDGNGTIAYIVYTFK